MESVMDLHDFKIAKNVPYTTVTLQQRGEALKAFLRIYSEELRSIFLAYNDLRAQ